MVRVAHAVAQRARPMVKAIRVGIEAGRGEGASIKVARHGSLARTEKAPQSSKLGRGRGAARHDYVNLCRPVGQHHCPKGQCRVLVHVVGRGTARKQRGPHPPGREPSWAGRYLLRSVGTIALKGRCPEMLNFLSHSAKRHSFILTTLLHPKGRISRCAEEPASTTALAQVRADQRPDIIGDRRMVRKLWNAYRLTPEPIRMAFGLMLLVGLLLGGTV